MSDIPEAKGELAAGRTAISPEAKSLVLEELTKGNALKAISKKASKH
jgi:hypothetical protein